MIPVSILKASRLVAALVCCVGLLAGTAGAAEGKDAAKSAPAKAKEKPKAEPKAKAKPKAKSTKTKKAAPAKAAPADDSTHPSKMPWNLRARFDIPRGDATMVYSWDNGEWKIEKKGVGTIVNTVGMTVTLADGTVLNVVEFERGRTTYKDNPEGEYGPHQRYQVDMPAKSGVHVVHYVDVLSSRPVAIIRADISNASDKPIAIAGVTPMVFSQGGISGLAPEAVLTPRYLGRRGGYPVYDPSAVRQAVIEDPSKKVYLSLGVFPCDTPAKVNLTKQGAGWLGDVAFTFTPPITLKPGETFTTPPAWVSFASTKDKDEDLALAWTVQSLPRPKGMESVPESWVTVPANETGQALVAAAEAARGVGIKAALVPAPWSGKDGATFDARALASAVKDTKLTPGLTVAPLAVQASEALTVASADGRRWLNVANAEAREFAADQFKKLTDWGYGFFVIAPTEVPDDALTAMGVTRAQADAAAFEIVTQAVEGRPVLPSAAVTLDGSVDAWLEAAAQTSRPRMYGLVSGPVRLDAAKVSDSSEALAMAMSFYGGPIEVVGAPSGKLKGLFPRPGVRACPIDACEKAPKIWELRKMRDADKVDTVVTFPGAGAWTEAELETDVKKPVRLLKVEGDKVVEDKK